MREEVSNRKELQSFEVFPCHGRREDTVLGVSNLVLSVMLGCGRAGFILSSHLGY